MVATSLIRHFSVLSLSSALVASTETYQFPKNGNPYQSRNKLTSDILQINIKQFEQNDQLDYRMPYFGHIFYPNKPGKYPWIDFFGGFFGSFPSNIYSDLIEDIVSMGFVITASNLHEIHNDQNNDNFTAWNEMNHFFRDNAGQILSDHSKMYANGEVELDVSLHAEMSHSAGGQIMKNMMMENATRALAYYPNDPVMQPATDDLCDEPIVFSGKEVIVVEGTELCNQCCTAKQDYTNRFFQSMSNYRTKTINQQHDAGHCSILNYLEAESCRITRVCKMEPMSRREVNTIHECAAGIATAAFTDAFFSGREDMTKYYTNPENFCSETYSALGSFECQGEGCVVNK